MKLLVSLLSLLVILLIRDSTAVDDLFAPLEVPAFPVPLKVETSTISVHTDHGHSFSHGGNAGIGGVNNENNQAGSGGQSGVIIGLNGYGGGNVGGFRSKFKKT